MDFNEHTYNEILERKIDRSRHSKNEELIEGGAHYKKDGRLEVTAEQIEAANKEEAVEKETRNLEINSLEELIEKAKENGAGPEEIEKLKEQLKRTTLGAEVFLAEKEAVYKKANYTESQLTKSLEEGGELDFKLYERKKRDRAIGLWLAAVAAASLAEGIIFPGDEEFVSVVAGDAFVGSVTMFLGAPIARIQDWLERLKTKREIKKAKDQQSKIRRFLGVGW